MHFRAFYILRHQPKNKDKNVIYFYGYWWRDWDSSWNRMRKCVEWNKKTRNIKDTFKYSGVAGSARVEPGVHVNYRCWCRWMWWLSSLSLLYTPLLSRAVAVLLRAFWVHGCALVHSFIIRYQITTWKKWKNDNECCLKLDLDPIQWETRSTGGCRWLSPSYPSIVSL